MKFSFYVIKNTQNDKCYVGMTKRDIHVRFAQHLRCAKRLHDVDNDYVMPFYRAIRKYGADSFTIELIESFDFESYRDAEIHEGGLIRKFQSLINENGYNLNCMNEDGTKYYVPEIVETLNRGQSGENNPFFGKTHTPEVKKILSEKAKKRFEKPENNPRFGYRYTEEDRENHRKANAKFGKPFYADGTLYQTLGDAARKYNLTKQAIKHRITSKRFTTWYYA